MKIRCIKRDYEKVAALPRPKHKNPWKPNFLIHSLIRLISLPDLWAVKFSYTTDGMEKIGKKEPCLILMNHSSFLDMEIANRVLYPRRYGIVTTTDAFVGMELILKLIGCIPTRKYVNDITLIRDMEFMLKKRRSSVLMYPEAGYSMDGTGTPLPRKMGVLLKKLGVPVVMIKTEGAFTRQPLYNSLRKRKVQVSAKVTCLATAQEVQEKTVAELDAILENAFDYDHFRWQQENGIVVDHPERATDLNRILYKCAHCGEEGKMEGLGTTITCHACGKTWELTEQGKLRALEGETEYDHIPDWYAWQRQEVRKELENGTYQLDADVDIGMLLDYKALYMVGSGRLVHDENGFTLTGCDGKLQYHHPALASYSLNADYYWYEIGDIISIGTADALYYCFPKGGDAVAKTRLAAEELYKLKKQRKTKAAE